MIDIKQKHAIQNARFEIKTTIASLEAGVGVTEAYPATVKLAEALRELVALEENL